MSLVDLIRKRSPVALATAIPAIPATDGAGLVGTVARIATVAVANPTEAKNDSGNSSRNSNNSSRKPGEQQTRTAWLWRVRFPDRNPLEVAFSPEASHAEVLATYPAAIAAEPIGQEPGTLTAGDDAPSLGDDIPASAAGDERRFCSQCLNLRGGACIIAKPGGLVSAIVGYRPALPEMLQRCAGYSPNASDPDQRPGHERWPGLSNYPKGAK